ncbi:MAG: hypothetical protein ACI90Z_001980, partial [Cyanobium sp.]
FQRWACPDRAAPLRQFSLAGLPAALKSAQLH